MPSGARADCAAGDIETGTAARMYPAWGSGLVFAWRRGGNRDRGYSMRTR
jgi:hypothetical protein